MSSRTWFHELGAAAIGIAAIATSSSVARASVPSGPPTFTHPLDITNLYSPFQPGGLKRYVGRSGDTRLDVLDLYLTETRTMQWNGVNVTVHILEEISWEDLTLVEISKNHFAQADDGTVYYFGEVVDIYENGEITSHEGSWLVGGPTRPTDPPETATAINPTVFMPANPELHDVFKQEDLFPIVDETDRVVRVGITVTVAAGTFDDVIAIRETTRLGEEPELKGYAPGVGVVKGVTRTERLNLVESTLHTP